MLSEEQKNNIIRLKTDNKTWKFISEAVGSTKDSCRQCWRTYSYLSTLPPKDIIPNSIISSSVGVFIKKQTTQNPFMSTRMLSHMINDKFKISISYVTIHRYLKINNIKYQELKKYHQIKAVNATKRFIYAKKYVNADMDF